MAIVEKAAPKARIERIGWAPQTLDPIYNVKCAYCGTKFDGEYGYSLAVNVGKGMCTLTFCEDCITNG